MHKVKHSETPETKAHRLVARLGVDAAMRYARAMESRHWSAYWAEVWEQIVYAADRRQSH